MDSSLTPKIVSSTIEISSLNGDIDQIHQELNQDQKKLLVKNLLNLPSNFDDIIDYTVQKETVTFHWYLPNSNPEAEILHKQAIQYARKSDLKKAIENWEKATILNPQDPDYFFNLGVAFFESKKYLECIDALTRTLSICPIYYKAHLILGIAFLKLRKFENAKKHIEKSLIINKNNVLAYLNLAAINSILKDYDSGIQNFEKVLTLSPNEANAYMGLAKIYSTMEDFDKANFYFKKVIEFDRKGNLANYAKRAMASFKSNREEIADDSIDIDSTTPEEFYSRGYCYYIAGDFKNSILMYKKYLTLKPNDDFVWYALGENYLRFNKPDLAAEAFKKAAKLSPSKGLYFKELGLSFDLLKMYDKVVVAMSKAKDLGKTDSITYCIWGKALIKLGKNDEAINILENSLTENKNNLLTRYYLAIALKNNNEISDALGYLNEVSNSNVNSPLKNMAMKLQAELEGGE